ESAAAHGEYLAWNTPVPMPGPVQLAEIVRSLRERLPADAIVANGAGNYTSWVHRFHQYRRFKTQLGPTSGAMGYGVPAAIAAKSVHPERTGSAFAVHGLFLMPVQGLGTALEQRLGREVTVFPSSR